MTTPAQQQQILSSLTSDPRFTEDLGKFSSGAVNISELTSDPQRPPGTSVNNPFVSDPLGFDPFSYRSPSKLVSPEQAADMAKAKQLIGRAKAEQSIRDTRTYVKQNSADVQQAQQEWESYVQESNARGLEANPYLFKSSNGLVPQGQSNAYTYFNKVNGIQNSNNAVNKRIQQTVQGWRDQKQEAENYAKWKAKQTGDRAATEPLPDNTNQSSPVTQESQQNFLPPAQQNITDPQPIPEGPTTGSELSKYILNTTGTTVTTSAPITIDVSASPVPDTPQATQTATSDLGQSFINKTGTVTTTREPTFSANKPGIQTEPVGGAELGAPPIQESSKPQTAGSRQGGEGGFIGTNLKIGAVGAAIEFADKVLAGEDPIRAAIKSIVGAGAGILAGGAIEAATGNPVFAFGGGTAAARAAESLVSKGLDLIFGTEGNQGQGQAQGKAVPTTTQPPAFQGGQCDGVQYDVTITAHSEFIEQLAIDKYGTKIYSQKSLTHYSGLPGPLSISSVPLSEVVIGGSDKVFVYQIKFKGGVLGIDSASTSATDPVNPGDGGHQAVFDDIKINRMDGLPDNCGNSPPLPTIPGIQSQTNVTNITNITYEQPPAQLGQPEKQTQLPPSAPPDDTSKKGGNNTTYIPAGKSATITTPNGQQIPIPASNSPQSISTPKGGNGQIQVNPGNGQSYTLSSPGNGPVQINIPGYKPYTVNPDGSVEGATPNVLNPSTFVPTPLTATPLKSSPLQSTPLTPTQQATTPATPTTPDLQPLLTAATVTALLTPILQGISNKLNPIAQNTTPQTLAGAAEKGCCDAFAPGGCNAKIGQDAADAARNSNNAAAGIGALDLATTNLQLANIAKTVGVGEFPATVPASLVTTGLVGAEVAAATTSIPNLARFGQWHVEQLDALMGAFNIPIQIPGAKNLNIPNVAEGMAEQIGMEIVNLQNTEMLLNLCTKTIAEVGQIKQQAYKTYMAVEAIIDYLNFKHTEVVQNMPLSFVPGEGDLMTLLQDQLHPISVIKYDDTVNQRTILLDLAQAAAVTRAVHFVRTKGTTVDEVKTELINRVKAYKTNADNLQEEKKDAQGHDSIDRFYNQIQHGYTTGQNPFTCEGEEPPTITRKKNPTDPAY